MKTRKNNFTVTLVVILLAVTAVAAILHFATRTSAPEGSVLIEGNGVSYTLDFAELRLIPVRGEMRTNKGEVRDIDARGIALRDAILVAGFPPAACEQAEVTSDDGYHAALTGEEVMEPDRAYLILQEEGGVRLIVFGDDNSKRNVSNVAVVSLTIN